MIKNSKMSNLPKITPKAEYLNFSLFTQDFKPSGGYAVITTTLIVLVSSLTFLGAFSFFAIKEVNINRNFVKSIESRYISESGIEDATYRIVTGKQIGATETLSVGTGSTTIRVTSSGNQPIIITSEGKKENLQQKLETKINITTTSVNFNYGVQIGDGGLIMENNSAVNGSVYSNGSITGNTGATITGDAFVAAGTSTSINQAWTVQNTDVAIGVLTGSIVTVVDPSGTVDGYTSLVLGSDGLARISYIGGDENLRMARCINDDCTNPVLTTVDSPEDIDEVTSIALGADGFPRISYYQDTRDDLKFARCNNADCNVPPSVLTTVDETNNTGDYSSLKMGADGFARIAYWYDASSDVRFARCLNADCTLRNIRNVETAGNVGEYISLTLGADGLGRMSYYDASDGSLKYTRCLNADCTTPAVITTIDGAGPAVNVGKWTSILLGSDGLARISYHDTTNGTLKFVRCTNADCTTKIISVVDPGNGDHVGGHTSLALGSDGFARISYYDTSRGDLKFARCLDIDCASAEISRVDNASSVGLHTSLAMGSDGLGRISYWAQGARHLKYVRCTTANCPPPFVQADVAQSFQPTVTNLITRVDLYLKKVGAPADATLRLIKDSGGRPSSSGSNVLTTAVIPASLVSTSYGWVSLYFLSPPTLNANTPYWLVIDSARDDANYLVWGGDSGMGYTRGAAKRSTDWTSAVWDDINADLDFRVYMGGINQIINMDSIGGNAGANRIESSDVTGNANTSTFNNGTVGGNINANSISNCTVGGNASYNVKAACTITGTQTTPTTPPADPPRLDMPISQARIDQWKADAVSGGTITGNYSVTSDVSLGPKKITGNLIMTSNNKILTITGTIHVQGNIDISNGSTIRCSASYDINSCLVVTDSWIHLSNNGTFQGSGTAGSYLMFLSTVANCNGGTQQSQCTHHNSGLDIHNNATGAIFYVANSLVHIHNLVNVTEITAYKVELENNAVVTYEQGLQNAQFTSGPGGGHDIQHWKEIE